MTSADAHGTIDADLLNQVFFEYKMSKGVHFQREHGSRWKWTPFCCRTGWRLEKNRRRAQNRTGDQTGSSLQCVSMTENKSRKTMIFFCFTYCKFIKRCAITVASKNEGAWIAGHAYGNHNGKAETICSIRLRRSSSMRRRRT